jgi:urease accessory protein
MAARDVSADAEEALVKADAVLGRATEGGWPGRLKGARVDVLRLGQAEAQKSRLRKTTDGGTEVAISLDRGTQLRDGDILFWDEARRTAIVARVDLKDVLIIDLSGLMDGPQEASMATCVELGHALGNQHWPAVVKGTRVYVPLTLARAVMASVMKTHSFEGVTYAFVPGAEVIPHLAPHEARRLFGAAEGHRHGNAPGSPGEAPVSELEGRGAAWTEERGTSDEGRGRLRAPRRRAGDTARLMRVLQFGDSLLPIGSFSFSNALESAVQEGVVQDAATLGEFVLTVTRRAATSDGIALLEAHRAAREPDIERIVRADWAVFDRKLGEETRTMTVRMGRKLAEVSAAAVQAPLLGLWLDRVRDGVAPGTHPVALGVLFAELGSPEEDAFAVHQYGVAMTTLSAALRLMRIDHRQVQAILYAVDGTVEDDYTAVRHASLSDMASFAPMADILAAIHVRSHVRMFMN